MKELAIRFGITDGKTNTAPTWKCWTHTGAGKSDVYLICRSLKGALKASLHQSGYWHIAYGEEFFEKNLEAFAGRADGRFLEKWCPSEIAPGVVLAFRILTPHSAVNIVKTSEEANIVWIPTLQGDDATEIAILITPTNTSFSGWPSKQSMKTDLVGSFQLENGSTVWIVHRVIDCPNFRINSGSPIYFNGKSKADLVGKNFRVFLFGNEADGSRVIVDSIVSTTDISPAI